MVSTHPKHISQIGSVPQVGVKIKNLWNHHLDKVSTSGCFFQLLSAILLRAWHQRIFHLNEMHMLHGTGIFTYIYHKFRWNVGRYAIHGASEKFRKKLRSQSLNKDIFTLGFGVILVFATGHENEGKRWIVELPALLVPFSNSSCSKYRGSAKPPNDPNKKCIQNDNLINLINLNEVLLNLKEGDWQKHNPVIKTNVDTFGPNKKYGGNKVYSF